MDTSLLRRAFSSILVRGTYEDEKPVVDMKMNGSKQEVKRLTALVNKISKYSPLGKSILEDAAKAGFSLEFGLQMGSAGYCSPEDKKLCLNPMLGNNSLTCTLAHECRHAQQHAKGMQAGFGETDIKSEVMRFRAMEADAQSAALMVALEMRANTNEYGVFDTFRSNNPKIVEQLPEELTRYQFQYPEYKANAEDMQKAFLGWYKSDYMMTQYEKGYIQGPMKYAMEMKDPDKQVETMLELPYKKQVSSAEIVNQFCHDASGKCYWDKEPNILERNDLISLSPETKEVANQFYEKKQQVLGRSFASDHNKLPERRAGIVYVNDCAVGQIYSKKAPMKIETVLNKLLLNKKSR